MSGSEAHPICTDRISSVETLHKEKLKKKAENALILLWVQKGALLSDVPLLFFVFLLWISYSKLVSPCFIDI